MTIDSVPELARRVRHLETLVKRGKPADGSDNASLLKRISALESSVARIGKAAPTKPQVYTPKPAVRVPKPTDNSLALKLAALEREVERLRRPVNSGWQSYTPTWTAGTTNPSIGNGTIAGRYVQLGKTVICSISLVMGSTTTYGSGNWSLSLPKTVANNGIYYGGQWMAVDVGTTNHAGQVFLLPNVSVINYFLRENVALDYLNNITPHTWASGDVLYLSVTYETA